jgi:hypothetical protein
MFCFSFVFLGFLKVAKGKSVDLMREVWTFWEEIHQGDKAHRDGQQAYLDKRALKRTRAGPTLGTNFQRPKP